MELDELKNAWNERDPQSKPTQPLTTKFFDTLQKKKFYVKLNKIILPEILGSLVCLGGAFFIGFNFAKLARAAYQVIGVTGIVILVALPIVSWLSIQDLYKTVDADQTYQEAVRDFAFHKKKFSRLQRTNLLLCYLLLLAIVLLLPAFLEKKGVTGNNNFLVMAFSLGFCFLLIFSKWVIKRYQKTIRQAEDLLKELAP